VPAGAGTAGRRFRRDRFGAAVEASSDEAVRVLDDAVVAVVRLAGDPVGLAEHASAIDPSLALALALRAYLHLYAASTQAAATARRLVAEARSRHPSGAREHAHLDAAEAWAAGELEAAVDALERALLLDARDLLALKVAQDLYLALGERASLRDVVARVLPSWPDEAHGSGWVRAMHAFGLEECGEYAYALARAESALAVDREDVWGVHAVLHVHEMQGHPDTGRSVVEETSPRWSASYFAPHNWWHGALFDLSLGEDGAAIARYDSHLRHRPEVPAFAHLDAASLLWRLRLLGVDPGDRAEELVELFAPLVGDTTSTFSAWHAAMAFTLAGHDDLEKALSADLEQRLTGTQRLVLDAAGLALLRGTAAFAAGSPAEAVALLRDIRPRAEGIGGSRAQRDAIDLTLLAAAAAAGEHTLVRALLAERQARSAAAGALGRRLAEANRHARRPTGGSRPGADALEEAGELDLLGEVADELGVGRQAMLPVRRREVETADGVLSALVWGDTRPEAVFLHGLALNAHTWDAVLLALGRPAAALDLPGHGESAWRSDGRYGATTIAPAVARAVESLAGPGAVVVGQSLGGLTAIELARLEPRLVSAIVLVDITPGLQTRRAATVRAFVGGQAEFASREEIVERALAFGYGRSRAALERGVWHNTTRRDDGSVVWKHHIGQLPGGGSVPSDPGELWAALEAFPGKVLLIWAEDGFLDEDDAGELCRRARRAAAVRVPGGHNVQELEPLRLAALVSGFLDSLGDP
jgi:pimeloyl-ACP methyl ester carboxylesterase/tetratricopeptide (TPR) repeat protein